MRRAKKWLFRFLAAVVLPLLALLLVELVLRVAGYGYPTDFFKPLRIGGQEFLVENDSFGFRFFPKATARTPATFRLTARKAPDTFRIFLLGESAAMGDPEPAFGAGRYLEVLLRERFPQTKFEVVNVAMTAINSHAILPIARDCARRQGDLWIVYMGNNEMVGPFGVSTAHGVQRPAPLAMVRLSLALQTTRLGQLLAEMIQRLGGARSGSWSGLQMFAHSQVAPDDPRRQVVYRNFERNLRDIVQAGLDSGAGVLLSTVAVNLKDCPPFGSMISSRLSATERLQAEQLLAEGTELARASNWSAAIRSLEAAAKLNPQSAELEFRLGNCWLQLTNRTAAREHFQHACDDDSLTFRADSEINRIILHTGTSMSSPRLAVFDARRLMAAQDAGYIAGKELFYEHVHLNFEGNYRLAKGWAEAALALLPESMTCHGATNWASQESCERLLGLTDWDRGNVFQEVRARYEHPPLNGQSNNAGRLRDLSALEAARRERMNGSNAVAQARGVYLAALAGRPEDYYLRQHFGNFLWDTGDIRGAIEQWTRVRELFPQDYAAYYELGRLAAVQGRLDEAGSLLNQALAMRPSFAPGWFELGRVRAARKQFEPALQAYQQALVFMPQDSRSWFYSGVVLALLGRRADAVEHYRQAVRFAPEDWRAHFELGSLLGQEGQTVEAKTESEAAVRLNPNFVPARLNLGLALVQLGQNEAAEWQFREVLRLDPTNSKAADCLAQVKSLKRPQR